jgi:hypothetical protein
LREWLPDRLVTDYPALAGPPPAGVTGLTQAAALLAAGLITPVLDGLDEIPEPARAAAIGRINDALPSGGQVLVTCRTRQYRDAARPPDGLEVTLAGAAAIELHRLDAHTVRRYLRDGAPGPVTRARWDPVLKLLGTQAPAGQALTTPLMVALARTIYNPRPGEAPSAVPDPAELCGFADRVTIEAHLFDAFIPAAYRPSTSDRWTAGQAGRWLAFLARHLEHTIGTPDLAWWQLDKAAPRTVPKIAAGFALGLAGGLTLGLTAGLTHVPSDIAEAVGPRIVLARDRQVVLFYAIAFGLALGLTAGFSEGRWMPYTLARGWLAFRGQLPGLEQQPTGQWR